MVGFYPYEVRATGSGGSATTGISYDNSTQTTSVAGKGEVYYLTAGISAGVTGTYTDPYSIIYLKKSEFQQPRSSDISVTPTIKSIDISSDATYWKIKVVYNALVVGSPDIGNPFNATIKNYNFANGDTVEIKTDLFTKDNILIATSTKQITVKTYVVGINSPDNGLINGRSVGEIMLTDDDTDISHTHIKAGYTDPWTVTAHNGRKHLTDTEVFYDDLGIDKRKVRTILELPTSVEWDPTLPNNANWTYNAANRTITQDVIRTNQGGISLNFTVKFNGTQTISGANWTSVVFPQTNYLVNDDNTVDADTMRKSNVRKIYKYTQKLYITKNGVFPEKNDNGQIKASYGRDAYVHLSANDGKHKFLINVTQYWGNFNITNSSVKFKAITDIPRDTVEFSGYGIRVFESMFDATNLNKLKHNKLIGVNDDNSEEVIATNINYTPVTNVNGYYAWNTEHSITPKHYKSIRLEFDDEITVSGYDLNAIGLLLENKLTETLTTTIENRLAAGQGYNTENKAQAIAADGSFIRDAGAINLYQPDYTKIDLRKEVQKVNGNSTLSSVKLGDNIEQDVVIGHYAFLDADRTVENAKVIVLVDPELLFVRAEQDTYRLANRFTFDNTPQIIEDYKGTNKTAYVFTLNNFTEPKSNLPYNGNYDRLKFFFKPTTSLEGGNHKVEAILSWTNNSTSAMGYEPNVVYSMSNTPDTYLDKYDANDNGNTGDRLSYATFDFNFVPPRAVILTKKQRLHGDTTFKGYIKAEKDDVVEYKLSAWNNASDNTVGLNIMDIFPYANDKAIVKDVKYSRYIS